MEITGYDIYYMRREIGYTKRKVEKESGISQQTLIRWENKNKKVISGSSRDQLLKLFTLFYLEKSIKDDLQLASKIRKIFSGNS